MADDPEAELPDTQPSSIALPVRAHPGLVVGQRWRLERFVDGGGMGAVWRATDLRLEQPAAVKLLNAHLAEGAEARVRFFDEARAAARLRGPNVVHVLDFDIDPELGAPYMAMELLEGEDLAARLRRGPLDPASTRTVLGEVARAVRRAHRAGIVHRDLKPANIHLAVSDDGVETKVLDFGIAKLAEPRPGTPLTQPNRALGTPHYMSPEQIDDARSVDHRADLWALAVIVYECLTGRRAFPGTAPMQVIHRICFERPAPASSVAPVPDGFDAWFERATRRDPAERFQTVDELLDAFLALGIGPGVQASSPAPRPTRSPRARAWASDANQVEIETLDQVVFRNARVDEFVEDDRRHFVSGAKGCGKTLLLTYKRARLSARYLGERRGEAKVTFIPEGRPYLDLMSDLRLVNRSLQELMGQLSSAKRLWGFALRLSVVAHEPAARLPSATLAALPVRLRAVAEGQRAEPTVVVREVLALTVSQIHQLLDAAEMALEHALRAVHSGVFVFIDKLDQALRGVGREAWISMQAGLVEAAWDLMSTNPHVKVFATIREEAFSAYQSDIKTNLFGALTRIRYTKDDLREMVQRLSRFYEGVGFETMVDLEAVHPRGRAGPEPVFDFLHRHTLGRPRDFVIVASELSRRRGELGERGFVEVVQETCSSILVVNVFDEMRVFLEVLHDREERLRFFAGLPFGAMTRDDLVEAWCRFHAVARAYFDEYGHQAADVYHPFRELYDCGLLGVVLPVRPPTRPSNAPSSLTTRSTPSATISPDRRSICSIQVCRPTCSGSASRRAAGSSAIRRWGTACRGAKRSGGWPR